MDLGHPAALAGDALHVELSADDGAFLAAELQLQRHDPRLPTVASEERLGRGLAHLAANLDPLTDIVVPLPHQLLEGHPHRAAFAARTIPDLAHTWHTENATLTDQMLARK